MYHTWKKQKVIQNFGQKSDRKDILRFLSIDNKDDIKMI
jgi:hypothetical protein